MTGTKCFQCGFVSSSSNQTCKRCGSPLSEGGRNATKTFDPKRSKRPIVAIIGLIAGSVFCYVAYSVMSTVLTPAKPLPLELVRMLSADDALKLPLVAAFPNAFTKQINRDDLQRDALLEDHREQQVLERLGLISVSFTKDKNEKPECWRYRLEPQTHYADGWTERSMVPDREGFYERCEDVWNYHTSIDYLDPEDIDRAALSERVRSVVDISLPVSHYDARFANRGAEVSSAYIPIGSIEIVEVSEVVAGNSGTYTVGFKFRFKPNNFGELFDVNSSVHRSLPIGIRELFKTKLLQDGTPDKRLLYLANARSAEGLTLGHADLVTEGVFDPKWKIAKVYLDQVDKTAYKYHSVELASAQ